MEELVLNLGEIVALPNERTNSEGVRGGLAAAAAAGGALVLPPCRDSCRRPSVRPSVRGPSVRSDCGMR